MSTTTVDYEGGTARLIKLAPTGGEYGIALYEWVTYRDETYYFVARTTRTHFLRISDPFKSEAAARKAANAQYHKDRD